MALNANLKICGFECQTETTTLNVELKKDMMALHAKPKMNNGSERLKLMKVALKANIKICIFERQTETTALNVITKKKRWLRTP